MSRGPPLTRGDLQNLMSCVGPHCGRPGHGRLPVALLAVPPGVLKRFTLYHEYNRRGVFVVARFALRKYMQLKS